MLKFAKDHTNPIRGSAFTYCENELLSRLDLGKEKYGGPFTIEQVKDIRAFLAILRILLTIGPILTVDFSMVGIFPKFAGHLDGNINRAGEPHFKADSLLITLLIPLYLCL